MRTIYGVAVVLAAGVLAASAYGLTTPTLPTPTLPEPTVPTPTLPAVTVPVPVPTAPLPTTPLPPAPAPTPTVPGPPAPVPTTSTPTQAPTNPAPRATRPAATATSPSAVPSGPATRGATPVYHGANAPARSHSTASANAGRRTAARGSLPLLRPIVARFRLRRAARVHVSVQQLAPVCRRLRGFVLALPKGEHAFHFPAGKLAQIGTYRLIGTVRGHTLFAVRARRLHERVARGGTADVCRTLGAHAIYALATPGLPVSTPSSPGQLHVKSARSSQPSREAAPPPRAAAPSPPQNPLVRAVSLTNAPSSLRPLLLTLLAIAIVLLALAAAPQRLLPAGRAAAIVAERRMYFAAAGIWLLAVVAVVTAFA